MGKADITKFIVFLLALIVAAVGFALDVKEVAGIGTEWWPLIALAVGVILGGWVIYNLQRRNQELLNTKPSISTELVRERDVYLLKITNTGEQATFKAQLSLSSGDPSAYDLSDKSHYQACWATTENYKADIPKGHCASIKLAELHSSPPHFNIQTWHLFHCDNNNQENYIRTSSNFIGAYNVDEAGNRTPYEPPYDYKFHVVISSNPSLREGIYQGDFLLSYQRGLEYFNPNNR